jgi:hypothetical protein
VNGGLVAIAAEPEMPISEAPKQVSRRIGVPGTRAAPLAYFQSNGSSFPVIWTGWLAGEEPVTLKLERGKEPGSIACSDILSAFEFVSGDPPKMGLGGRLFCVGMVAAALLFGLVHTVYVFAPK